MSQEALFDGPTTVPAALLERLGTVVGPSERLPCARCGEDREHITLGTDAHQCSMCGAITSRTP